MPNRIYISKLNPITFRPANLSKDAKYMSNNYNDYMYHETLLPWEEERAYFQKWMTTDVISAQFTSNFADIAWRVVDCDGRLYYSANFNKVRSSKQFPDSGIYENAFDVGDYLPTGKVLFVELFLGGQKSHVSEPMMVYPSLPGSFMLEYSNNKFHEGMVFETGYKPQYRVEGHKGRLQTGSQDQYFIDQTYDTKLISSKPHTSFPVTFGNEAGLPDYAIDKLNYIWSCSNVKIDGFEYAKSSDAAFEFKGEDRYPMRAVTFVVSEGVNRGSYIYEPTVNINERITMLFNIDGDAFGEMPVNLNDGLVITGWG